MPAKQYSQPEDMHIDPSQTYDVTMVTSKGTIKLRLFPDVAPQHVNSFVFLSREGFYDGLTFHRYEPGFVIQGGDPVGNGTGGPGYNPFGRVQRAAAQPRMLAMARSSNPNSGGSQFYITLANANFLDRQYTVFGEVTDGMDVVQKIRKGDTIQSVTVEVS
ncbi:MAG: peptidylprolyl isomerase [Anaerolineae bacterium]|nr:peptidylprolyl isomerase [Anaerolineae bacterium]